MQATHPSSFIASYIFAQSEWAHRNLGVLVGAVWGTEEAVHPGHARGLRREGAGSAAFGHVEVRDLLVQFPSHRCLGYVEIVLIYLIA